MTPDERLRRLWRQAVSGDNEANMRLIEHERLCGIGPKVFETDTQLEPCIEVQRHWIGRITHYGAVDLHQGAELDAVFMFVDTQTKPGQSHYPVVTANDPWQYELCRMDYYKAFYLRGGGAKWTRN